MGMQMISLTTLLSAILCFWAPSSDALTQEIKPEPRLSAGYSEVEVPMEDGILLATDVYIPKKHDKFPVVLVRTPYNKDSEQWLGKAFGIFGIFEGPQSLQNCLP